MTAEKAAPRKPVVQKTIDLNRFAREGEAITVRNKLNNITVFVAKIDGQEETSEFAAHGDGNGEDYMELPSAYLKNARFREALKKEILEIVEADDPEVLEAFEAQKASWRAAQVAKEEADRMVVANTPRAYSGAQCLAQEGRSQCPEFAITSKTTERPPLCQKHAHLSHQFTPEETGKFIDGKPEVRWIRVEVRK